MRVRVGVWESCNFSWQGWRAAREWAGVIIAERLDKKHNARRSRNLMVGHERLILVAGSRLCLEVR